MCISNVQNEDLWIHTENLTQGMTNIQKHKHETAYEPASQYSLQKYSGR